jgi:hypothetical protein
MPSQIKKKKKIKYSSLFLPLNFARYLNLFFVSCVLNIFRTFSPPTSCYRLGLCPSTLSRSWWSWLTSGRTNKNWPSVTITWTKTKSPFNFKLKIKFTFRKDLNWQQLLLKLAERRYWNRSGWPRDGALRSGQSRSSGRRDGARNRKTWNPWLVRTNVRSK